MKNTMKNPNEIKQNCPHLEKKERKTNYCNLWGDPKCGSCTQDQAVYRNHNDYVMRNSIFSDTTFLTTE